MECLGVLLYDSLLLSTSSLEDFEMDNPIMIQEYHQQFLYPRVSGPLPPDPLQLDEPPQLPPPISGREHQ
ncbi:hypothetical protein SLEP1_g44808 [Rubroshorea leprosula]|uniref:Uncharacterized protein n=1 Tax=Rubroshorea leprosula TaxID=152421 RepID=A0AAV5LIL2_9ROSI|nr:hypothetical protein SLEP1_g44808 [Rubroshorea leprosula]